MFIQQKVMKCPSIITNKYVANECEKIEDMRIHWNEIAIRKTERNSINYFKSK